MPDLFKGWQGEIPQYSQHATLNEYEPPEATYDLNRC